jgi:hypothetical protein
MDLIEELLGSKGAGLLNELTDRGFTAEQAQKFLPQAGQYVLGAMRASHLPSLLTADVGTAASSLLDTMDIAGLAARVGLDVGVTRGGLERLIPVALGFLKGNSRAAALLGLLGGGGVSRVGGFPKNLSG